MIVYNCYFYFSEKSLNRMMKMCMSMGVSWIFENLPKFDNSNAIKLLKVIMFFMHFFILVKYYYQHAVAGVWRPSLIQIQHK